LIIISYVLVLPLWTV